MSSAPPLLPRSPSMSHEDVLQHLARSGVLGDCVLLWLPEADGGVEALFAEGSLSGHLSLEGHEFQLRVRLPRDFPLCLPRIQVERIEPLALLPHVLSDGSICFPEDVNLLDGDDPVAIALGALVYARDLLRDMLTGDQTAEFVREAVTYWKASAQGRQIECVVSVGERPTSIVVLSHQGKMCAVADDLDVYERSRPGFSIEELTSGEAFYIPVGSSVLEPGFHPIDLARLQGLRKHVRALSEVDRLRLRLGLAHRAEMMLVLGLRRPQGERALLGLYLSDIQGGFPLEDESARARCTPISLVRRDLAFLAPRGGAGPEVQDRRVLIMGCGAVGGYIAHSLARAGVGQLSLVDPDVFTLENTYRHACGMAWDKHGKVEGLRREIEGAIPYVTVSSYPKNIESLLRSEPSLLREQDLVISALGHPTIELHVNRFLWEGAEHPPALFTWLEPLGLGGHALLTHLGGTRGCLKCLYRRSTEGGGLVNRAAFAMPHAVYTRDTLGCGSRFLPFGDLDAQRTAEVAVRLALRVLRAEVTESTLMSWKGDRRDFDRAGYSVTPRYDAEPDRLELGPSAYHREDCPVCGPR